MLQLFAKMKPLLHNTKTLHKLLQIEDTSTQIFDPTMSGNDFVSQKALKLIKIQTSGLDKINISDRNKVCKAIQWTLTGWFCPAGHP